MSNLYGNLSEVYEAMYQSFINYDEEFSFYNDLLQKYNCKNVLEIGCGTDVILYKVICEILI
jgi:hypothetical protein